MKFLLKIVFMMLVICAISQPERTMVQEAFALETKSTPLTTITLLPGESRSVEIEYDGVLWNTGAYNISLITAVITDAEIHYLSLSFTPRPDTDMESDINDIKYFTTGGFIYRKDGNIKFLTLLDPRFPYGTEDVMYIIDMYPDISAGLVFSAVIAEYADFEFPFRLTLTATLSN